MSEMGSDQDEPRNHQKHRSTTSKLLIIITCECSIEREHGVILLKDIVGRRASTVARSEWLSR